MVKIPLDTLSAAALRGIIESFVLREGTDYGHREPTLDEKCRAVERQLRNAHAEIWFDPATETIDIRPL